KDAGSVNTQTSWRDRGHSETMCSQPQPPEQLAMLGCPQRPGSRGISINHLPKEKRPSGSNSGLRESVQPMQTPAPESPVAAYVDHLRASGASSATLRAYRTDLAQLDRWLSAAGCPPDRADTAALRRPAAYLGTLRYAPATAARKLSAMRRAYAW